MSLDGLIKNTGSFHRHRNNKRKNVVAGFLTLAVAGSLANCGEESRTKKDAESCYVDNDCPGANTICIDEKCVDIGNGGSGGDSSGSIAINGVNVKSTFTDNGGYATFIDDQTGKFFGVYVDNDQTKAPLSKVGVTFADGDGFNLFTLTRPSYVNHSEVFPSFSSSGYEYKKAGTDFELNFHLQPEAYTQFTIWEYRYDQDPNKYSALENFLEWSDGGYAHTVCVTREELKKGQNFVGLVLSEALGINPVFWLLNVAFEKMMKLEEWGLSDTLPFESYDIYSPLNFTGPSISKGFNGNCGSSCSSHASKTCYDGDVYWKDSCSNLEEKAEECDNNETCENGYCVSSVPSCSPNCGLGEECQSHSDCEYPFHCFSDWPGGMCVDEGCPTGMGNSCEKTYNNNAHCCSISEQNTTSFYCIASCDINSDCRPGYSCKTKSSSSDCEDQKACLPN